MQKKQIPFFLIAISVILGLTLPTIVQDGMFMDGMLYTCVSKNLANGVGSFWFPVFSQYGFGGLSTFHEHPPLVFEIEALFFKIFGNGMYTERIYIVFTLTATCYLIVVTWKYIHKHSDEARIGWLPLLLWISIPVCFWSFTNNMQENTMGIFILLSVLFYLKSVTENNTLFLVVSSLFVFLASFSKGIPGFFPLAMPFIYWATVKKINVKQVIFQSFILIIIPVLIYAVLLCFNDARISLDNYFIKRVLHRISADPTVESHFYILGRIFLELIPSLIIVSTLFFVFRKKNALQKETKSLAAFFILLGLAGVAPLILTMVQKGFYFIPSLPFFAIGLALFISKPLTEWSLKILNSKYKNGLTIFSVLFLCAVLIFSAINIGKSSRDTDMLNDVRQFGKVIPEFSAVSISQHRWNDWPLQCYLMRYHNISIDPQHQDDEFRILDKNATDSTVINYQKVELHTLQFDLYKKKN